MFCTSLRLLYYLPLNTYLNVCNNIKKGYAAMFRRPTERFHFRISERTSRVRPSSSSCVYLSSMEPISGDIVISWRFELFKVMSQNTLYG